MTTKAKELERKRAELVLILENIVSAQRRETFERSLDRDAPLGPSEATLELAAKKRDVESRLKALDKEIAALLP